MYISRPFLFFDKLIFNIFQTVLLFQTITLYSPDIIVLLKKKKIVFNTL